MKNQHLIALSRRNLLVQFMGGFVLSSPLVRAHGLEDLSANDSMGEMDRPPSSLFEDLKLDRILKIHEVLQTHWKERPQFQRQLRVRLQVLDEIEKVLVRAHDPWLREKARRLMRQDERAKSFLAEGGGFDWVGYASFLRGECWNCLLKILERSGESEGWVLEKHPHRDHLERVGVLLAENVWARWVLADQQVSWWIEPKKLEFKSLLQGHSICLGWEGDIKVYAPDGQLVQRMDSSVPLQLLSSKDWLSSPKWAMKLAQERSALRGS